MLRSDWRGNPVFFMIQLRQSYQVPAVYELIPNSFRRGNKRIIRCAPTGSGKSLEMSEMTRLAYNKGSRVLLLTHRKELFKSTLAHLGSSQIPCAELMAGSKMPIGDFKVLLAMEKTLWNVIRKDPNSIPEINLIIVDEGHFNNFTKIINYFEKSFVITFTATPQGKHIHKLYTDIIDNVGIPELIQQGYLTPCKPYMMKDPDGFDKIKIKGEDFDNKELFAHFDKSNRYKGVLEEYFRLVNGLKGIIFCVNVAHSIKTHETFLEAGVGSFICHSNMSEDERDRNIREFEKSVDGVMINCGILTTGYSHDPIMFVFIDRATVSLPLWLQMQGRGSRKYPGKDFFVVADFGENHTRLGLWNQPRTWDIKEPKKKKKQQAAPVKNCPSCGAIVFATTRLCEFCGFNFPKPTFELREGIMCEVGTDIPLGLTGKKVSECTIDELMSLQQTGKMKASYLWRVIRTRGEEDLNEYAKKKQYKYGWLMNQISEIDLGNIGFRDYIIR